MQEFAIFNDEGIIEDGFYSREEAAEAIADRYSDDDGLTVEEVRTNDDGDTVSIFEEDEDDEEDED